MQQQTRHACTPEITRTHRRGRGLVGHRQQRAPRAAARGRGHALERAAAAAAAQLGHQRRGHPGARVCRRVVWSANRIEALLADSLRSDTSPFFMSASPFFVSLLFGFFFNYIQDQEQQGAYFFRGGATGRSETPYHSRNPQRLPFPWQGKPLRVLKGAWRLVYMLACWAPPIDRHTATLYTAPSAHG